MILDGLIDNFRAKQKEVKEKKENEKKALYH